MSQDMVIKIRELYESWIKDDATFLDSEEIFNDLLEYVTETKKDICGKCIPCRDGIPHIGNLLAKFEDGTVDRKDLLKIEEYVANLRSSKCSVGIDFGKNMEVILRNNFNDFYKKVRK
ncbi:NADH-ubiquinone oxidoreductase-F iron-sulfur binding region domain-containing protein [Mycoplasmatota bacterium WC44]